MGPSGATARARAATALLRASWHTSQTLASMFLFSHLQCAHFHVGSGGTRGAEQVLHKLASISALSAVPSSMQ